MLYYGEKRRHCASGEASRSFSIIFRRRQPKEYDLFISLCVSKTKTNKIYTELFTPLDI